MQLQVGVDRQGQLRSLADVAAHVKGRLRRLQCLAQELLLTVRRHVAVVVAVVPVHILAAGRVQLALVWMSLGQKKLDYSGKQRHASLSVCLGALRSPALDGLRSQGSHAFELPGFLIAGPKQEPTGVIGVLRLEPAVTRRKRSRPILIGRARLYLCLRLGGALGLY
jgi:hypothetical protein